MGRDLSFERAIRFAAELIRIPSLPGEEGAAAARIVEEMRALGFDEARTGRAGNAAIPLGRFGDPAEVWLALRFVLECGFFTGRVLEIDGGARM